MPIGIWTLLKVKAKIFYLPYIPDESLSKHLKKIYLLSILQVISQCTIGTDKSHISTLPLSSVPKRSVRPKFISITMNDSPFSREQKYHWIIGRGSHATLTLATEALMKISTSIIGLSYFKH
jgi:hypothetical protein